ncbi:MAG: hypothetical protein GY774_21350 [Planctomycetes bacterium]|nr:hypothetical protein [Planctomycetota bacterium]
MKMKSVILISIVLMSLPGFIRADNIYIWTGAINNDWMTASNWDVATVPSNGALGDDADAYVGSTTPLTWPVLDSGDTPPEIDDLWIANGSGLSGELLIQGGVNLQCGDDIKICYEARSVNAKLTIKGPGTTVLGLKSLELGEEGTVIVDLDGGKLEIGQFDKPKWNMILAASSDSNVTINIRNGGLLEHHGDYAEDDRGGLIIGDGTALIDIGSDNGSGGGTLKLKNDVTELVRSLYRDGIIVADGGTRDVEIQFINDYTVVTASTLSTRLNPDPVDGSTVLFGPAQIQWTLPEPNSPGGIVTCDVYFGTNPYVEANPKIVTGQAVESVAVTLDANANYYWALDLYDSSISTTSPSYLSPIFSFNTMNLPPIVNAGDDVATWLDNGLRTVQIDGVISDLDGGPGPATLLWTVIAEPNESNPAQISDSLAANPTATLREPGSYTLQLEAGDGELTATDTMQILLYADSCEHAKNQEDFEQIPGDINEDCIVNEQDLAILEAHWLEWNYSTE